MYQFEEMNPGHFEEAKQLWAETEGMELTVGDSKQSLEKYLSRNPAMSFICRDSQNENLLGTILCGHDGRRGFIYHVAVDKNYRRKNIAKQLVDLSLKALKKSGIERCSLMVKTTNNDAYSFWEKMGWRGRTDLFMFSKDLSE
jgi:N-acetylglutamate synthase